MLTDKPKVEGEDKFQEHLLEQYKLYVEMMDRTSARRGQSNSFFISILTGLLSLISILMDKKLNSDIQNQSIMFLILALLGLILCFTWHRNIDSYKELNSLKFKVISEMENHLPFPCYGREWEIDKEKSIKYRRLTKVEKFVPIILGTPYLGLATYSIFKLFKLS
jgi:hypothetical protein